MIISRTPFRISFFGGGTDYPVWYRENPGAVLATTIDKYCYLLCRWLPPFFDHKHYIAYSEIERIQEIDEIKHPAVRETLKFLKVTRGVGIHHASDLPARTGIGSSSAFTVGLLNALYTLQGISRTKAQLALDAIEIEQNMIRENVGSQDQTLAAFGGFNRVQFAFYGCHRINVTPITLKPERLAALQDHLMLFFTGFPRTASQIAKKIIEGIPKRKRELTRFYEMVSEAVDILQSGSDLSDFGNLLHEAWLIKRTGVSGISTDYVDYLYEKAMHAGAIGGKLTGVGGGGFLLLFVPPEAQDRVRQELKLLEVPFEFESSGSTIIFYEGE